jgi:outer membrane protein
MHMSRWIVLGIFLLALSPKAAFAEEVKLGYVDLQRALNETEDGRKAKANLKKVFDQKQKELDEQQEALKKDIEDLNKKRTLLPADKVREKEAELQDRMQKVQQTYMRHQQDLSAKEQEATAKIFERMSKIIGKIATAENFTMVFDRQQGGVLFAKPHLDLTNDLIRRYNSGEGASPAGASTTAGPGGGAAKSPAPPKAAIPVPAKK